MRRPLAFLVSVLAAAVVAAAACTPGAQQSGASNVTYTPPALYPPLRPDGATTVPLVFVDAENSFVRGAVAYQIGSYHEAAEAFFHVAEALAPPPQTSFAGAFAANRALAYHNAAVAWTAAGEYAEARVRLAKAADTDVDCHEVLVGLLELIPDLDALLRDGGAAPDPIPPPPPPPASAPEPTNSVG